MHPIIWLILSASWPSSLISAADLTSSPPTVAQMSSSTPTTAHTGGDEVTRVFATRDDGSGSGGLSGGAIAGTPTPSQTITTPLGSDANLTIIGIIIAVLIILALFSFLIYRARRTPFVGTLKPAPAPPYPEPYLPQYTGPRFTHQTAGVGMPPAVHLGTRDSGFYAAPPQRGVRFGEVGVRRYQT